MEEVARHRCLIYEGAPSVHLPVVRTAIIERLHANYRCLYLNSPPMVAGLRAYVAAAGVDVAAAVNRGALVLSSEQDHLVAGEFDADDMLAKLARAVKQALADGYSGLWASGDMLWEFGNETNLAKLLAYEIGQVALYTHQTVYVNETLSRFNPHYRQLTTLRSAPQEAERRVAGMLDDLGS